MGDDDAMAESSPALQQKQPWWYEETVRRTAFARGYHEADISRLSGTVHALNACLIDRYASAKTVADRIADVVRIWQRELDSHIEAGGDPRVAMIQKIIDWVGPEPDTSAIQEALNRWDSGV